MARKRYSDEDALRLLRKIDAHLHDGNLVNGITASLIEECTHLPARRLNRNVI
jgi:hypothetical protein